MLRQTLCLLLFGLCATVAAHEGHDHAADQPPAAISPHSPRFYASNEQLELVAIQQGAQWHLYLDRHDSNEPVPQAKITLEADGNSSVARSSGDHYLLDAPWLSKAGRHLLVVSVESPQVNELLSAEYTRPASEAPTTTPNAYRFEPRQALLAGAGIVVMGLLWRWSKRRHRRAA